MKRKVNILKTTDWTTIVLYFVLVFLGWLNIYAAVYNEDHQSIFDISQRYGRQLLWIIAAIIIAIVVFVIDSKFYSMFAYIIYGIMLLLLISVLLFGKEVHGARSWFEFGDFRVQPAEFAKFATALALAKYLSSFNVKLYSIHSFIIISAIIFFPALLIVLQNDTGSALVYISFILVLYREGLSGKFLFMGFWLTLLFIAALTTELLAIIIILFAFSVAVYWWTRRNTHEVLIISILFTIFSVILWILNELFSMQIANHLIVLAGLGITLIPAIFFSIRKRIQNALLIITLIITSLFYVYSVEYIFYNVLEKHQRTRINVLLGLEEDIRGAGYNVHQSLIAIGSGGLYGKGFLQGTQTKYNFVPEQSTDFIFCTVGEEWGFIGSTIIILLFLWLLLRIIILAEKQRSAFSRIYGYGVAAILFFHLAINVGMTIGLAPVIGIPLPFFSYGGSSLWAFTILLFIFIRLDASRMELFLS